MKKTIAAATLALLSLQAAEAGVVFANPTNAANGNCVFSTTCAASVGAGNDYAAQAFTLSSATTLTGASFTAFVRFGSTQPSAANWMFLLGTAGTPGAVLASGQGSVINSRQSVGSNYGLDLVEEGFSLPSISLAAGNYFFAVQAVSSDFQTYLATANGGGAFETHNGGVNWSSTYAGNSAVAVSLFGADAARLPEPTSLALVGLALAGVASVRRRKQG
ncbi:PEP-CTERM sorting domain-containing protein [Paucibacter sp. APW11]|uniref:PEP-CTERM sorting domain-containing protein n=1 Tax=Roseateles aquae TaxID=3077235 RepID=A0ABU3PCI9_9BURK|nr:PEP-CTERM sorting domain-containing protein [Paucibacter sp. APW11]MDT9000294.1 PEP-CTERM sorting domain-containing protein [Paucibacter sp. APW11]